MSRILHCIATLRVGGVENRVLTMFEHFALKGARHEHLLCAFQGGALAHSRVPDLERAGFRSFVVGRSSRFSPAFLRNLQRTVKEADPDIIHAYNPTPALWMRLMFGRGRARRIVVHCGGVGTFRSSILRTVERALLDRTSDFIFNSHSTACVWNSYLPIRCRQWVIYNGIASHGHEEGVALTSPPMSPFTLLTVCRVTPIKSIETQIRALAILHQRGQEDVRLVLVGDGPHRSSLETEAVRLGVADAISFEGFRPDPRSYHDRAHVYLCTSYNETFGLTLGDAMLSGMVCVASSVGGPSEMIEDGRSGFLLPCTVSPPTSLKGKLPRTVFDNTKEELRAPLGVDPAGLADKIAWVRDEYGTLGPIREAARRRIVERFTVDEYCQSLEAMYDALD